MSGRLFPFIRYIETPPVEDINLEFPYEVAVIIVEIGRLLWLQREENEKVVYTASNAALGRSLELSKAAHAGAVDLGNGTAKAGNNAIVFVLIASVIVLVVAGGLSFVTSRSINKALKEIIDRLSAGSEQVKASSIQLTGSSQDLAESASEQAASVQETTSSLEEMGSQITQTAQASQAYAEAGTNAQRNTPRYGTTG